MRHGGPPRGYVPAALKAAFARKRSGREIRVSRPNAITHCEAVACNRCCWDYRGYPHPRRAVCLALGLVWPDRYFVPGKLGAVRT
jgi:hypothetical protein